MTQPSRHLSVLSQPEAVAIISPLASADAEMRLKAEGFPSAPLIEAVMAVQFEGGLSDAQIEESARILSANYAKTIILPHREIMVSADSGEVAVSSARQTFRLEGVDETEIALIRPDGLAVSQLAPYKCWELLFARFARDFGAIWVVAAGAAVARLAVRYINRIDVPLVDDVARHEDYLALHIHVPDGTPPIDSFHLQFQLTDPGTGALALIQSAVLPPVVEDRVSIALDIDLARTAELPADLPSLLATLGTFRDAKNRLYRQFLTAKALEDFR